MNWRLIGREGRTSESEQKEPKNRQMRITQTGRVWVKPSEVVATKEFKKQLEAVKRLREAREESAAT